ncbi:MAG: DVU_1555 family C-GCAxxG-C-C protein [Desulfovibrionaceae bacterium]
MIDETSLRVLALAGKGYCCSQIMALEALGDMGRENPDLVRAMAGLCKGMGDCAGICGVFSGAACVLGLHTGKGEDMEQTDERLALMLNELAEWFAARCGEFGGTTCLAVCGNEEGRPDPARCGVLVAETSNMVRTLLMENEYDPTAGR